MLLGQLYYYNKVLNNLSLPLTKDSLLSLEVAAVSKAEIESWARLSVADLSRKLKDQFIHNYAKLLQQEGLTFAYQLWLRLTSAKDFENSDLPKPKTAFQEALVTWQAKGSSLDSVPGLLKEGELSVDLEDFALFYGIKVLAILSHEILTTKKLHTEWQLPEVATPQSPLTTEPNVLILTSEKFFPLFVNLNCQCLPLTENLPGLVQEITQVLSKHPHIKLILIDSDQEKIEFYLHKNFPSDVLVTTIKFSDFSHDAFFDRIVRKTLGVRLT